MSGTWPRGSTGTGREPLYPSRCNICRPQYVKMPITHATGPLEEAIPIRSTMTESRWETWQECSHGENMPLQSGSGNKYLEDLRLSLLNLAEAILDYLQSSLNL